METKVKVEAGSKEHMDELAKKVWRWLGKPDIDPDEWVEMLTARYQQAVSEESMDADEVEQFLKWVCMENEHTVNNLRVARDAMRSLTKNQWDNCLLRWKAWKAVLKARERKSWKNGPCIFCDEREAMYKGAVCKDCDITYDMAREVVDYATSECVMYVSHEEKRWWIVVDGSRDTNNAIFQGNGYSDDEIMDDLRHDPKKTQKIYKYFFGNKGVGQPIDTEPEDEKCTQ